MAGRIRHLVRVRRSVRIIGAALALTLLVPVAAEAGRSTRVVKLGKAGDLTALNAKPGKGGDGGGKPTEPQPSDGGSTQGSAKALVLYDQSGTWGWMGEKYAIFASNLVSHFGTYVAKPVDQYQAGEMANYTGVVYIGSTYDENIPVSFLDDTLAGKSKVMWVNWNVWQLSARAADFAGQYGWMNGWTDTSGFTGVRYKGQTFDRHASNGGILGYQSLDTSKVEVLAEAVRADGSTMPWAVRSQNLTFVGEIPFSYMGETDRYLIFSDLLFDLLAPQTQEQHRAMVRLEDVGCDADPQDLRAITNYLKSKNIPFSFGVFTWYKNPTGADNGGVPQSIKLGDRECQPVADEIRNMIANGGTMIMHGYTHQFDGLNANPYNGRSGDDFEFYTAHVDTENYVRLDGPVPGDSTAWALSRVDGAAAEFKRARLPLPTIFEFPHYAASATDYQAIGSRFNVRYERALYFNNVLKGGTVNYNNVVGQFFPYVVSDVYGTKVLPENIGNIETESFNHHPITLPPELVRRARLNLAVRDGFASFFYHPHLGVDLLKQTVEGIEGLGYQWVSPASL